MEIYLNQMISYLVHVFQTSFNQLFILFGPLLILVLFLNFSATLMARLSVSFWGSYLFLYGFGWLGCSIHELSHALFALIFGHKIKEITLFEPNSNGESLGHVSHSYNKKSVYQKIGNFFIGIGPLLAGGLVLFLITGILFKINVTEFFNFRISIDSLNNLQHFRQLSAEILNGLNACGNLLFSGNNVVWWKTALLVYILYSIGGSMTLSKSDVKGAIAGFVWLVIFIVIFNISTLWIGDFATRYLTMSVQFISMFYFLLILSFAANILFILLFFVLNLLKSLFFHRK